MAHRRKLTLGALLAIPLFLSACGGSGHPVCVDPKTAQEYSRQFVTDMIAAAGKVDPKAMQDMQSELNGISKGNPEDFSGFCTKLDALRAKYGI